MYLFFHCWRDHMFHGGWKLNPAACGTASSFTEIKLFKCSNSIPAVLILCVFIWAFSSECSRLFSFELSTFFIMSLIKQTDRHTAVSIWATFIFVKSWIAFRPNQPNSDTTIFCKTASDSKQGTHAVVRWVHVSEQSSAGCTCWTQATPLTLL